MNDLGSYLTAIRTCRSWFCNPGNLFLFNCTALNVYPDTQGHPIRCPPSQHLHALCDGVAKLESLRLFFFFFSCSLLTLSRPTIFKLRLHSFCFFAFSTYPPDWIAIHHHHAPVPVHRPLATLCPVGHKVVLLQSQAEPPFLPHSLSNSSAETSALIPSRHTVPTRCELESPPPSDFNVCLCGY